MYPFCSSNSARSAPSWPVTPVIRAILASRSIPLLCVIFRKFLCPTIQPHRFDGATNRHRTRHVSYKPEVGKVVGGIHGIRRGASPSAPDRLITLLAPFTDRGRLQATRWRSDRNRPYGIDSCCAERALEM